jgi:hypothetical protein
MIRIVKTLKTIGIILLVGGISLVLYWLHKTTGLTFKSIIQFLRKSIQQTPTPENPSIANKTSEIVKSNKVDEKEMKHSESANKTIEGIDRLLKELENA